MPTESPCLQAAGDVEQGMVPSAVVKPGCLPTGSRASVSRLRRKCKAYQNERDEKEPAPKRQRASRISSA